MKLYCTCLLDLGFFLNTFYDFDPELPLVYNFFFLLAILSLYNFELYPLFENRCIYIFVGVILAVKEIQLCKSWFQLG